MKTCLILITLATFASAQTFQRLGACPTLGCVFPPDQTDFLAGQLFDIRLEVHAPVNGSEATSGVPDENFTFHIQRPDGKRDEATKFFNVQEPELEKWTFSYVLSARVLNIQLKLWNSYYEDLFAQDAGKPTVVNVASKVFRAVSLSAESQIDCY